MRTFVSGTTFVVEDCCVCGIQFAMTADFAARRRRDRKGFHCPSGHSQHYVGKTPEEKLRQELEQARREIARKESDAAILKRQRENTERRYKRMKKRVANGVCPCCNRTFQNLMAHMKSEHPEFSKEKSARAVRLALGMTQGDLAAEIGCSPAVISLYENGKHVSDAIASRIDSWAERTAGA